MSAASTPSQEMSAGASRRADAHRCEPEHLDDPEDPGEDVVGDGSLDEGETGDVDEGVPDAHEREGDHRDGDVLPEADGDEREAR